MYAYVFIYCFLLQLIQMQLCMFIQNYCNVYPQFVYVFVLTDVDFSVKLMCVCLFIYVHTVRLYNSYTCKACIHVKSRSIPRMCSDVQ